MGKVDDTHFARVLLEMGLRDEHRLHEAGRRDTAISIALWTAHELRRHAGELDLDAGTASRLRHRAGEILRHAAQMRTAARADG